MYLGRSLDCFKLVLKASIFFHNSRTFSSSRGKSKWLGTGVTMAAKSSARRPYLQGPRARCQITGSIWWRCQITGGVRNAFLLQFSRRQTPSFPMGDLPLAAGTASTGRGRLYGSCRGWGLRFLPLSRRPVGRVWLRGVSPWFCSWTIGNILTRRCVSLGPKPVCCNCA